MNKNLDYLDLEIKFENFQLCKRVTEDKNKVVCFTKENFKHRIHSSSNSENFEQLNTIIDLICNLSQKIKLNSDSNTKLTEQTDLSVVKNNINYLKHLIEDNYKEINIEELNKKIKTLTETVQKVET